MSDSAPRTFFDKVWDDHVITKLVTTLTCCRSTASYCTSFPVARR